MKTVIRISMLLGVLLIAQGVKAHQADVSSTMLVEQGPNKWVLQVRAALTAFEYEVHQHFGKNAYTTPEEFNELVVQHLEDHISILYNNANVAVLQNGIVRLGHETSVVFEVIGTPAEFETVKVSYSSFGDISRNKSALIVYKKDFAKDQFVLDNDNGHTAELEIVGAKFELVEGASKGALPVSVTIVLIFVLIFGLIFAENRYNRTHIY